MKGSPIPTSLYLQSELLFFFFFLSTLRKKLGESRFGLERLVGVEPSYPTDGDRSWCHHAYTLCGVMIVLRKLLIDPVKVHFSLTSETNYLLNIDLSYQKHLLRYLKSMYQRRVPSRKLSVILSRYNTYIVLRDETRFGCLTKSVIYYLTYIIKISLILYNIVVTTLNSCSCDYVQKDISKKKFTLRENTRRIG